MSVEHNTVNPSIVYAHGLGGNSRELNNIGKTSGIKIEGVSFRTNWHKLNPCGIKSQKLIAKQIVAKVLDIKEQQGVSFDPGNINLVGASRGAAGVHDAAAMLQKDHGIAVHSVIQVTPVLNAADYLRNCARGNPQQIKEAIDAEHGTMFSTSRSSLKSRQITLKKIGKTLVSKAILKAVSNQIFTQVINRFMTGGGYELSQSNQEILNKANVPVIQIVGLEDPGIDIKGIRKNALCATKVMALKDQAHGYLDMSLIEGIIANPWSETHQSVFFEMCVKEQTVEFG